MVRSQDILHPDAFSQCIVLNLDFKTKTLNPVIEVFHSVVKFLICLSFPLEVIITGDIISLIKNDLVSSDEIMGSPGIPVGVLVGVISLSLSY
ncbi:MAG: hypothetical protein HQM09_08935 [Candidatus Riflebacteria bacterium]|nr:hypothetical protein [Candidatus Riflebacteria bacterium]